MPLHCRAQGARRETGETKTGYLAAGWVARNNGFELVSRPGLEPGTLALKGRKDPNINSLILRRFPRFSYANKDLR